jgi:hypothetical protein
MTQYELLERELAALRLNLSVTMEELGEMRDRAEKAEAEIAALLAGRDRGEGFAASESWMGNDGVLYTRYFTREQIYKDAAKEEEK